MFSEEHNAHNRSVLYDVASEGITTLSALCIEREDAERLKAMPDEAVITSMVTMRQKLAATRRELPTYDEAGLQAFIDRYAPVIRDGRAPSARSRDLIPRGVG